MSTMFILLVVWGVVIAILLILLAYRATVTRYEEDQLFLSDAGAIEVQEQSAVLQKVRKIRPYIVTMIWLTCLLAAAIIALFIVQAIKLL